MSSYSDLYTVFTFNKENFAQCLSNGQNSPSYFEHNNKFEYLFNYLDNCEISAKTIILEDDYISRDFLLDYKFYYSTCFQNFEKRCKRLHFFDTTYTQDELEELLKSNQPYTNFFNNNTYLGFIVSRPIPKTPFGTTVLRTFRNEDRDSNRREYWSTRDYRSHIAGRELVIRSLAWQQQDTVVAACATAAVWVALQKTSQSANTSIKTPSEITVDAGISPDNNSRLFPNNGLSAYQIVRALNTTGLECEVRTGNFKVKLNNLDESILTVDKVKSLINAYSKIGTPLLALIAVPLSSENNDEIKYGYHAVALSGHKINKLSDFERKVEISLISDQINEIYIHDDQIGPFSRAFFNQTNLITDWSDRKYPTYVLGLIIPVPSKVRVSYEKILLYAELLDNIFFNLFNTSSEFYWDIKVIPSEDFKSEIINQDLQPEKKNELLTTKMPKYIWVISTYLADRPCFYFIFDATGINTQMLCLKAIAYDEEFSIIISTQLAEYREHFEKTGKLSFFEFLLNPFRS